MGKARACVLTYLAALYLSPAVSLIHAHTLYDRTSGDDGSAVAVNRVTFPLGASDHTPCTTSFTPAFTDGFFQAVNVLLPDPARNLLYIG